MNDVNEICCYYIALLRSVYLVHQSNHWLTKGSNFYSKHLLLERIYKSAGEDADLMAEKMIGVFGENTLNLHMQAQLIGKTLEDFVSGDPINTSLDIEKKFIGYSERLYDILEKEGKMTLGLSDALATVASNREAAVYLLKQSLSDENKNSGNHRIAARKTLLERFKKGVSV